MSPKQRVMAVINHDEPDHVPCFGANSTVTYEQMRKAGAFWPEGHEKAETMAKQALAAHAVLGFDAVRVPFDQACEAQALGCRLKSGDTEGIPGIEDPPPYALEEPPVFPDDFLSRGRIPELLEAVRILKKELGEEVPVVGGIVGAFTITASLVGIANFFKAVLKTPERIKPFLNVAEKAGTALARALTDAGADIIANEDMYASPDVISARVYREHAQEYQSRQFQAIHVPKILHICGKVDGIAEWMGETGADILSVEPKTDFGVFRERCGEGVILMSGVDSADRLLMGDPEDVRRQCEKSVEEGIQILAPGCAVPPGTPTANLLAMVAVARKRHPVKTP